MVSGEAWGGATEFIIEWLKPLGLLTSTPAGTTCFTCEGCPAYKPSGVEWLANNTREQAMLGDFQKAIEDAILDSNEAHQKQMMKLLSMPEKGSVFANIIYEMLNRKS